MDLHISKYYVDKICKTQHITQHTEVVWKLRGYLELMIWIFFFADLVVFQPAELKYLQCFGGGSR